jgi:succinate dehydrogenase / fumarate reductase cytochrome b subunit
MIGAVGMLSDAGCRAAGSIGAIVSHAVMCGNTRSMSVSSHTDPVAPDVNSGLALATFASGERVPLPRRGSVYRGDAGMWSWVAHRITGVLTFFFLFAHVLDTALVRVSPEAYNSVIETYKNPLVNLLEVGLVAAVLYHALNGVRIMLVDFWAKGAKYQRLMLWIILAIWFVVMIPGVYFMLQRTVLNMFGSGS